jgi:hypothetical protein
MKSSRIDRAFDIQCNSRNSTEAESEEKHAGVGSNTFTMGNLMPESTLKVHKRENFLGFDFEICTFSLLVMPKC